MWFCVWLLSFTVFKVYPCCCMYQYCTPFNCQIIFQWVDILLYVYSPNGHLNSSHFGAIMTNDAVTSCTIYVDTWMIHWVFLTLWGNDQLSSIVAISFKILSNVWGSQILVLFTDTCYFPLKKNTYSNPGWYEVGSHYGFDLYFPTDYWY